MQLFAASPSTCLRAGRAAPLRPVILPRASSEVLSQPPAHNDNQTDLAPTTSVGLHGDSPAATGTEPEKARVARPFRGETTPSSETFYNITRIVRLVTSPGSNNPMVVATDPSMLSLMTRAMHGATIALKRRGSDKVVCFSPTVNRGTMRALLESGISLDRKVLLKLSTMPAQEQSVGQATTPAAAPLKVSKTTDYQRLSSRVVDTLFRQPGPVSLVMIGDASTEVAVKALLSARTELLAEGSDIQVIPRISPTAGRTGELKVLKLVVHKVAKESKPVSESTDSKDTVTISTEQWNSMNQQIEELSKSYQQLSELLKHQSLPSSSSASSS